MRAVNLIPRDARRSGVTPALGKVGSSHMVIGLLVIALAFVTVYVLTANTVSKRKAQLASMQQQVTRIKTEVSRLQSYQQFEQLAQARANTVRQIASQRFDWSGALNDLSKVVPANTSLQSVSASDSSNATSGSATTAPTSGSIRSALNVPAFVLKGCTGSQDEVAQLMSRLRVINGVMRVTLEDSSKPGASSPGAAVTAPTGTGPTGCPSNGPSFDMVVFFQPMPGQSATGSTTGTPGSIAATTPGASK